jgi:hypothetical protein
VDSSVVMTNNKLLGIKKFSAPISCKIVYGVISSNLADIGSWKVWKTESRDRNEGYACWKFLYTESGLTVNP